MSILTKRADRYTGIFEQGFQDAERLIVNAEPHSALPQFSFFDVQFERAESDCFGGPSRHVKKRLPLARLFVSRVSLAFSFISWKMRRDVRLIPK